MSKYIDAYGQPTGNSNPNRQMWYSVRCTFWTDDWGALKTVGPGIPVCPHCQSPGYQSDYTKWDKSARRYDEQAAEGYHTFLQEVKGKCLGPKVSIGQAYKNWCADGQKRLSHAVKQIVDNES